MYHYYTTLAVVGLPEECAKAISEVPALSRFTRETNSFATLKDVPRADKRKVNMIILSDDSPWTFEEIEKHYKDGVYIMLCTNRADKLDVKLLDMLLEIWPLPLTPELARHGFRRMQRRVKADKDAWITRTCLDIVIETLPDMVWFKDMPGCHLKVNDAFCDAVGKTKEDVTNKFHSYIWGVLDDDAEHGEAVCHESELKVAAAGHTCLFDEEVMHAQRGLCQLKVFKTPVYDENHDVIGTVGIARDITREKEAQEKILNMARTDALTGLSNRRYFYEYVDGHRGKNPLTLCYIDLDHFKELNDTHGHQAGDAALLSLAELLRLTFPRDFITRLGGDEFVVALFNEADKESVTQPLEAFNKLTHDFFSLSPSLSMLTMSIGVTMDTTGTMPLDTLLQQGDEALYYSKETQRGTTHFYDDVKGKLQAR